MLFSDDDVDDDLFFLFFFFKQKTAYEIGTGDWSSDVCSSDLLSDTFGEVAVVF